MIFGYDDGTDEVIIQESERMTELKPCPFCGAKAMLVYCVHGIGANWGVECTETHAHRIEFSGTQDEVIKEWNQRAIAIDNRDGTATVLEDIGFTTLYEEMKE